MDKFSIWLMPSDDIKSKLQSVVNELATQYHAPVFEPHLTLLGNVLGEQDDIVKKTAILAKELKPIKFDFGEISFSTTYFQAVLVRIKATADLLDAALEVKNIFGVPNDVFMPHMSLLYGDNSMQEREKIASGISLPKLSCVSNLLVLTPAVPDPADWEHIVTFTL